jgi:hypothetical protein
MRTFLYFFIYSCINFQNTLQIGCNGNYNGTTPDFKQIFIGRCYYFLNILHADDCAIQESNINCTQLYLDYEKVIIGKEACDIHIDDFNDFLNGTNHPIEVDTSVFWSGTYTPAHECNFKIKHIYRCTLNSCQG